MTNNKKHRWTIEEDKLCCRRYLEHYVVNKSSMDANQFIELLKKELPNIKTGSFRMKIQNIKQILHEKDIKDSLNISPLPNYSKQNMRAMVVILKEMNFD